MKAQIILCLFCLGLFCCTAESDQSNSTGLHPTYKNVDLSDTLESIISDFVKENKCKTRYNEMFFDKVDYNKTIITLKARHAPETEHGLPLYYTEVNGAIFLIYTGMESYFKSDMGLARDMSFMSDNYECPGVYWSIVDSAGQIRIIKAGYLPFSPIDSPSRFAVPEIIEL